MSLTPTFRPLGTLLMCLGVALSQLIISPARAADEDFAYHTTLRDTLIGIGRRLLLDPRRWREVQVRNHISNPNRMPTGTILHIPYAWLRMSGETATVMSVGGAVNAGPNGVAVGDVLPPGAVIETGVNGSVSLQLADGSSVTLQKSSVLKLDEMARVTAVAAAHSVRLRLDAGRLETQVKPHRDVGRFEIITPIAVAAVRGTQFRDSYETDGAHGTTETLEGTVGVAGGKDAVAVAAGFGTRVEENKPPLQPVPLLPPPQFTDLAPVHASPQLELRWSTVSGAAGYRVQLASDAQFHVIGADLKVTETHAAIGDLKDGEYWLRVRSIDQFGIEGSDAIARLTQHLLPAAPLATAPRDAAKLDGSQSTFTWSAAGPSAAYRLQISPARDFAETLIDRADLKEAQAQIQALPRGDYYWRVASANSLGEWGPWSAAQSFTQRPDPPIAAPPDHPAKQVHLVWAALPGEHYRVEISHRSNFTRLILDSRVDSAEITTPKLRPGIYYVRLQNIDVDGSAGPFGAPRRFVVPIPTWVEVLVPFVVVVSLLI